MRDRGAFGWVVTTVAVAPGGPVARSAPPCGLAGQTGAPPAQIVDPG